MFTFLECSYILTSIFNQQTKFIKNKQKKKSYHLNKKFNEFRSPIRAFRENEILIFMTESNLCIYTDTVCDEDS